MAKNEITKASPPAQIVASAFAGTVPDSDEAARAIEEAMAAGILTADDQAGTFLDASLHGWDEYPDVPVRVERVRWNASSFDAGLPVYAVVELVRLDTGEKMTVDCSSTICCAQLRKWELEGWLPTEVTLQKLKQTSRGYTPFRLFPLEQSF